MIIPSERWGGGEVRMENRSVFWALCFWSSWINDGWDGFSQNLLQGSRSFRLLSRSIEVLIKTRGCQVTFYLL